MFSSSTLTFSMGSGERKRCSNMAPVRKLRSLAWMKARRLPGVRCSTLNTECRSLLCLMIMPGRSWVAGIDIAGIHLLLSSRNSRQRGRVAGLPPLTGAIVYFTQAGRVLRTADGGTGILRHFIPSAAILSDPSECDRKSRDPTLARLSCAGQQLPNFLQQPDPRFSMVSLGEIFLQNANWNRWGNLSEQFRSALLAQRYRSRTKNDEVGPGCL